MTETIRKPKSVLRDWVTHLTLQMQGTLLCAMRGPDGANKHDPAKALIRGLRAVITVNARKLGPNNSFAGDGSGIATPEEVTAFFKSTDHYVYHWFNHFMHAAEVIGYMHPDERIAVFWRAVYLRACDDMHVNPETKEQMCHRLRADGDGE